MYHNLNYMLAGYIVETVCQCNLMDYLHDEVFAELGLQPSALFAGRTFAAENDPREPWYESTEDGPGILAHNLFYPAHSEEQYVERPYGSWSHENRLAQGGMVGSPHAVHTLLHHFMVGYSRERTAEQIGRRRTHPVADDENWRQGHTGSLTGANSLGWQRSDGLSMVMLFNSRPSDSSQTYTTELLDALDIWLDDAYKPEWEDIDGDGVANADDAFPRALEASLDFDGDGLPDKFDDTCDEDCVLASRLTLDNDIDDDGSLNHIDPDSYNADIPLPNAGHDLRVFSGGGASVNLFSLALMLLAVRRRAR